MSERAPPPPSEALAILSSQPSSRVAAKAKSLLGGAVEQPLAVMPITVWNPPAKGVRSPPRRAEELKKKEPESKSGGDGTLYFLMLNLRQEQSRPSLRTPISRGRKHYPLMKL